MGQFGLDGAGFVFAKHESQHLPMPEFDHLDNEAPTIEAYLEETIDLVHNHLQADTVICYDWRVTVLCGIS